MYLLLFQHRYETLNRAGHHHADYDRRLDNLFETLSSLQTTFHNIQEQENNSNVLFQLKVTISIHLNIIIQCLLIEF